jgi:RND family efflux transporter MFP subunit
MSKNQLIIPTVLLAILVGCNQPQNLSVNHHDTPVKIQTSVVKKSSGVQSLTFSGTILPYQTIPVSFQTAGTVLSVLAEEGNPVKKGQVLAILDKTDFENIFNAAEAQYQQALDAYTRLKEVHAKGSLAEIKWVEMESNLKQAESSMKLAKNNLEKTVLKSPESGIVGRRRIEPGMSSVNILAPFEVVKIDHIYVRLSVPENEISKIKPGMIATFSLPALGDMSFTGKVSVIGVVADALSRTYEVKVLADNPDHIIKPGMICDLKLEGAQQTGFVVDYRAVSRDNTGTYVYKVIDNRTRVAKQRVKTGYITSEGIEILAGLEAGDEVVCEGLNKLKDNCKISL